jgi:hypothetical protein
MAWKVDEAANFVFVQLIQQEPGMYVANCARRQGKVISVQAV